MSISTVAHRIRAFGADFLGVPGSKVHWLVPGVLLSVFLAWVSTELSQYVGSTLMGFEKSPISAVMMAILLGLIVGNLISLPAWVKPGLTFSVKKVLRLGIILLGIRLSIFDVLRLGALGVPIVLVSIVGALLATDRLSRWLRLPRRLGALIAVGTSICGVSAIVSTGPTVRAREEEVAYAVAVITVFGIAATLAYPYLAYTLFAGEPVQAGLFLGTSIHDTSQVTGAALVFSDVFSLPRALEVATVTKLVRNVAMVVVIPFMALRYARNRADEGSSKGKRMEVMQFLPLFVLGFLLTAVLRSVGDAGINVSGLAFGLWDGATWSGIHEQVQTWAVNLLVVALAGVGLSTRLDLLKDLGVKPFLAGLGAAFTVGVISYVSISLAGLLVAL